MFCFFWLSCGGFFCLFFVFFHCCLQSTAVWCVSGQGRGSVRLRNTPVWSSGPPPPPPDLSCLVLRGREAAGSVSSSQTLGGGKRGAALPWESRLREQPSGRSSCSPCWGRASASSGPRKKRGGSAPDAGVQSSSGGPTGALDQQGRRGLSPPSGVGTVF